MSEINSLKARASALINAERFTEALVGLSELCIRAPQDADAWYLRGAVHHRLGQVADAIAAFRQAVAVNPGHIQALTYLGAMLEMSRDLAGAEDCYRTVLGVDPDNALVRYNLGNVLRKCGRHAEAVDQLRVAARLNENEAEVHLALGVALKETGDRGAAIAAYDRALTLNPNSADAHCAKGAALREVGRYSDAIAAYDRALTLNPNSADAHCAKGDVLKEVGRYSDALRCFEATLKIDPRHVYALNSVGIALVQDGRLKEARESYARAMEAAPAWAGVHSNLLLSLNYDVTDGAALFEAHRAWARTHVHGVSSPVFANVPDPKRRLRVGYVSPDFRAHAVVSFIMVPLKCHDRAAFEVFCYANVDRPDGTTERVKSMGVTWRDIYGVSDIDAARLIRDDGIDILVDLAGHTGNERLILFAQRPAPVQLTWLGYPNTTGLDTMDYRLTDAWADPPGTTDSWYTERLVRLPRGFLCFAPPGDAASVAPPPFATNGFITFGSFNNFAKVTDEAIERWSEILHAVPGARLVLKNFALGNDELRTRVWARFKAHGIEQDRVVLRAAQRKISDHWGMYGDIDIALDTFPYNGTTTTCEALWMGVPVVTLAGSLHAGRVGVSLLNQAGLPELVADDADDYVRRATALAADRARLTQLRQTLRARVATSQLCNASGFTRDLEAAYREMWTQWCEDVEWERQRIQSDAASHRKQSEGE